jgi:hypothetical protein
MNGTAPKFDTRVEQYVKLRDMIKAIKDRHKEELAGPTATLEKLNAVMLAHLDTIGGDSVKTEFGTVSRTRKRSATIADMSAFWDFIVANDMFEMVDKKANVPLVEEYIETNGTVPPGINFSTIEVVGVRRS